MTFGRIMILAGALLMLASACVSKPPVKPDTSAPVVVTDPAPPTSPTSVVPASISKADLTVLHDRVLGLRKQAFDLGAKELAAEEFNSADTHYIEGKTAFDADKIDSAKISFETAEPLFKVLIAKTQKLVAENRRTDADSARLRAENSGAPEFSADVLALADQAYADGLKAYSAGDNQQAAEAFARALALFDGAEKRARAVLSKNRIDELGYASYDTGNYQIAGEKLASADEKFATDPLAAVDLTEEALLRFNLVLSKGWELSAGDNKVKAAGFKTKSDEIKASVAVKNDYVQAQLVWDAAGEAFEKSEFEYSFELFAKAEALFSDVYTLAAAKRANAQAAMTAAAAKREQSTGLITQGQNTLDNPDANKKAGE